MALNFKNAATEQEVAALARITGESEAEAVRIAARERRERLERDSRYATLERAQNAWRQSQAGLAPDDLDDDAGLPA